MKLRAVTCHLVLVVGLLGGAVAPSAQAATVSQSVTESFIAPATPAPFRQLLISGLPGERNNVTLSVGVGEIVLRDMGSPLAAEGECQAHPDGSVSCPQRPDGRPLDIKVELGDEDDVVTVGSGVGPVSMNGGAGADRMTAGESNDTLDGGAGPDILIGGAGDDRFHDLARDGRFDDLIDGGSGVDTVAYGGTIPITVRMTEGTIVSAEQRHRFSRVESVLGSSRADVMIGSPAGDILDGAGGADHITGGAGADVLIGGNGRDVIRGGRGDDLIDGSLPDDRRLDCGPGDDVQRPRDDVRRSPYARFVQVGCERVAVEFSYGSDATRTLSIGARPVRVRGRIVTFDARCPMGSGPCSAQVWLRSVTGRLLGRSGQVSVRAGGHGTVRIVCRTAPGRATVRVDAHMDQSSESKIGDKSYLTRLR